MSVTKKPQKTPKYFCNICDFSSCNKKDYDKHMLTIKHKKRTLVTKNEDLVTDFTQKTPNHYFKCESCNKEYISRNGLWKHRQKCLEKKNTTTTVSFEQPNQNVMIELLKQNQEFKELIIEQNKHIMELAGKVGNTINNTTNNNTNNFNLQFFLNEKCKDALNIMDFINQLQVKLTDLDMVGRIGYTEGISKIFIRGLKELDVFKRPVHCSDLKRETLYVKDQDSWEKDNDDKKKMKTAIKFIAAKNLKQLTEWKEENPESEDYDSKKHMEYHNIIINATGGSTSEEDDKNFNKIIKNVAKESLIDKEKY